MNYPNTDSHIVVSQPFITGAGILASSSEPLVGQGQERPLEDHFDTSQPQTQSSHWPDYSYAYDPSSYSFNNGGEVYGRPEPLLGPVSFRSHAPRVPVASVPANDMEPELDDAIGSPSNAGNQVYEKALLRCDEPGCDSQRIYATPSTLRRHQEKHTRPYACKDRSCNYRRFGNKAGLTRHCREVHGSKVYYCPFRSCDRHNKAFGRKYNLLQHQSTCHGDEPSSRRHRSSHSPRNGSLEQEDALMQSARSQSEDTDHDSDTQGVIESTNELSDGGDRLERKLRDLKAKRDRINRKIATLESAEALVGTNPR